MENILRKINKEGRLVEICVKVLVRYIHRYLTEVDCYYVSSSIRYLWIYYTKTYARTGKYKAEMSTQ